MKKVKTPAKSDVLIVRLLSRTVCLALVLALLLAAPLALGGCALQPAAKVTLGSVYDMNADNYIIGVPQGAASMVAVEAAFPKARIEYFQSNHDGYLAVRSGKIDAYAYDKDQMTFAAANLGDVELLDEVIHSTPVVAGINPQRTDLVDPVNAFIAQIKADGTYADMFDRWVTKATGVLPSIPDPASPVGTLRVGTAGTVEPFSYYDKNQQLCGFDIELIRRLALFMNVRVELTALDFGPMLAALEAGKLDLVISNLHDQQQVRDIVLLSDPYNVSRTVMMVKKGRFQLAAGIRSIAQLAGKQVGVLTGNMLDQILAKSVPSAVPVYFNTYPDQITAIKTGRIDAMILDTPIAVLYAANSEGVSLVQEKMQSDDYALALKLENQALYAKVDAVVAALKADGTLDQMAKKWLEGPAEQKVLPDLPLSGANGTLRFGTSSLTEPFAYLNIQNQIIGFDVELARRIASELGMNLEIVDMDFAALIPALQSGKADMIGSCITVTPERSKMVHFTPSYYAGGISAIVAAPSAGNTGNGNGQSGPAGLSFYQRLINSFNRTFVIESRYKLILQGLWVTVLISVMAAIIGSILGFLLSLMRRSRNKWASIPARIYIKAMQGTPIVVLLLILYYIIFGKVNISAIVVAILAFALNLAAYAAEIIRSGIEAVDRGQIEAASALGFTKLQVFTRITFPQAARYILPVFKGELVTTIKMTSVVGYIAIQDLTKMSDIIRSRTYEAFFPLIATALIYFLVAAALTSLLTRLEFRIDPKRRKRAIKGVSSR